MTREITIDQSYEKAIDLKKHAEDRRDEINKYYTSLFSAIVSIMPFIGKIQEIIKIPSFSNYSVNIIIILLSIIGLSLTISWVKVLKHIHTYIMGLESFVKEIEETQDKKLFTYLAKFLDNSTTPSKVTKHEIWIPYIFMLTYIITLLLSLLNIVPLAT